MSNLRFVFSYVIINLTSAGWPQISAFYWTILAYRAILSANAPCRWARAGPTPFSEPGRVEFSLVETHLSCELERTHYNQTPYAVDATGGGHRYWLPAALPKPPAKRRGGYLRVAASKNLNNYTNYLFDPRL